MTNPLRLFTSFDGRISRKEWWIGMLIIWAVDMVSSYVFFGGFFARLTAAPSILRALSDLIFLFPMAALMFKRLNDRGHTYLPGCISVSISLAAIALSFFGVRLGHGFKDYGLLDWLILFPAMMYQLLIFLDNAFLKGTDGPNQHGPNPLATMS